MPEVVNTPAADSTPAPTAAPAAAPTSYEPASVPQDPAGYANWRQTGKTTTDKSTPTPKRETPAPSKKETPSAEPADDAGEESDAPASEAGSSEERPKRRSNADTRLQEILGDLKRAGLTPAELKSFKRELAQDQKAAEATPEKTAKPAADPNEPKEEDFETYKEYVSALSDHRAEKAIDRYKASQQLEAAQKSMHEKLGEAEKRYGGDAKGVITSTARAVMNDKAIPAAVKGIFHDSPVVVDLFYALGSKPAELEQFCELARTNPGQALRKAVLVERLVTDELKSSSTAAGAGERGEDGKFQKPPHKKATEAPPPPREVSGRAAAPGDEVEHAAAANDFTRFRNAANRRDQARKKGM